ncbi:MAG: hypothetical protein KJ072_22960, partial [Verrucomicrobia bacterium]|nr:hypothetical protein [Verrucomicrobiota bacterium]
MICFDTSYVARLYLNDPGWEKVRLLAATDHLVSCILGRAETIAAFHRKFREGAIGSKDLTTLLRQFERECQAGAYQWLALSETVVARLLACAACYGARREI